MRSFTIIDCAQHLEDGTANPEWLKARLGRVTGSTAGDMLSAERVAGKGVRSKLKRKLAMERLTGVGFGKDFQSKAMEQGLQREPEARIAYERATGKLVNSCGFLAHSTLMVGCSPDGYVGDFEGLLSIKCPEPAQHVEYLRIGMEDTDYKRQIVHEQAISGARWHDFVSWCPEPCIPEPMQLVVIRFSRNDVEIKKHQDALDAFLVEVEAEYLSMKLYVEGMAS